jgi:hypothetical protein
MFRRLLCVLIRRNILTLRLVLLWLVDVPDVIVESARRLQRRVMMMLVMMKSRLGHEKIGSQLHIEVLITESSAVYYLQSSIFSTA